MINSDDRADKRQERREQTRAALLDAAERLWAERGIHGVSLDEIAGTAGLTKGAVYSNFTGKTDLLLALLDRHTQRDHGVDLCEELSGTGEDRLERAGHSPSPRALSTTPAAIRATTR
jgi:AcrR family transcriptional regulator